MLIFRYISIGINLSVADKKYVVGECKFKNEAIDKSIYDTLVKRATLISTKYKLSKYILFSLSGFSDWFKTQNNDNIVLISLSELYK